jgi:hypothetical protein
MIPLAANRRKPPTRPARRRRSRSRPWRPGGIRPRLGACTLVLALFTSLSALAPGAEARSSYPAGAGRPLIRVSRSELAGHARAGTRAHAASSAHSKKKKKKRPPPTLRGNAERALLAFEAMQRTYYIPGSGLYAGEPFSFLWPFSQAFAATVSITNVQGAAKVPGLPAMLAEQLHARLVGLASYLDTSNSGAGEGTFTSNLAAFDGTVAPPTGPGGPKYYDDNDWTGIELARVYELTHRTAALGSAEAIMAFEMAGWSSEEQLACPGGIPFSNTVENNDRNTVTNAPAAELALQLYKDTHEAQYLQFALKAYEWVRRCLLLPNQLYADHIGRHGVVEPTTWSYNQGAMIGAGTLLYQATGNGEYLYQARQTAKAALAFFTPQQLASEIPFFVSVYFRNLLYLDSVTHDPPGQRPAQAYVNYAWEHLRTSKNVFVAGSPPSAQLLVQAAIVQIYALLASPPSTYF